MGDGSAVAHHVQHPKVDALDGREQQCIGAVLARVDDGPGAGHISDGPIEPGQPVDLLDVSALERGQEPRAQQQREVAVAVNAQVERGRRGMVWAIWVGVPAGAGVAAFAQLWIGLGIAAMSVVTWLLGLYMTTVRRGEFTARVRDAEQELSAARAVS